MEVSDLAASELEDFDVLLDINERLIRGVATPPLLTGEIKLLTYMGSRPRIWHSTRVLASRVYQREDPGALQLVWKYFSTLRQKVANGLPSLLEVCRRRGYRCNARVSLILEPVE